MAQPSVAKLYQSVIDEVIDSMREAVLDEGLDEQVLVELKQLWEQKLKSSKALDAPPQVPTHLPINQARKPTNAANSMTASSVTTVTLSQPPIAVSAAGVAPGSVALPQLIPSGTTIYRQPQQSQPLDMSGAAAAATMALPAVYQQQLLSGQIQLQQTSTGAPAIVIPAISSAGLQPSQMVGMLQAQSIQLQPQNLSTKPNQVRGQVDGADDDEEDADDNSEQEVSSHPSAACCRPKNSRRFHKLSKPVEVIVQLDGADGSSSEDEDDIDDEDDDENDNDLDDGENEEEPLNSDDDVSGDEQDDQFETDNVVVCQYDKITRSKNRWRFNLKDGIMNVNQRDHVFQKAHGEAEW